MIFTLILLWYVIITLYTLVTLNMNLIPILEGQVKLYSVMK